jgi:hypothetical protein
MLMRSYARTLFAAAALVFASSIPAAAQQANPAGPKADSAVARNTLHEAAPTIRAARRDGAVRIDGRIDETAWNAAIAVTTFTQSDPKEGDPGSERTEARVLVDDEAIYVAMRLFDREPPRIQAELARRDESIEGDIAEVYLDSYHDHLTGYVFRLTPLGARRDAAMSSASGQDASWDPVWDGAASMDAEGWSAEFRIPLSQLRYDPNAAEHVWGIQLTRRIARKGETQFFAFVPKTQQSGINTYGHLTGLGRLPAPRRVELVPYALTKNEHPTAARGDPFRRRNEVKPGVGLDVKYGITSNLTLNATFNPDFGQVEVDPAVVNLSAFETFFPERRPFFVEGASIFGFGSMRTYNSSNGYNFTHTRRIGRNPQRRLGEAYDFIDAPLETTIAGAAKLSGRTKGGWSIGILDAVTTKEMARFRTALGVDSGAVVEPAANYFVGRLKRDLRDGNTTFGVALNTVHRALSDNTLDPFFRSAAYVGGFDWNHAWAKKEWSFDGAVVVSHNVGSAEAIDALQLSPARYFQRPDREGFFRDPTRTSLTGRMVEASLAKLAGKNWRFSLTGQDYHPGFEVNEVGFLGSTDMRGLAPLIGYVETRVGKYLRFRESFLFWNPTWNYDGDMTFNGVGALTFVQPKNYWGYFFRLDWRPPVIDDRLTRGGPVGVVPAYGGGAIEINSDSRKKHTYGVFMRRFSDVQGGWSSEVSPRLTLKPRPALRIQFSPSYNRGYAKAQYVTSQVDANATATYGTRYVFATLDQTELSATTRVDWTFTPQLSLQVFAQPLLASGDFLDFKEFARPRQFNFDVYGRDAGTITQDPVTRDYTVDPDGAGTSAAFTFGDPDFNSRFLRGNALLRWEYRPGSVLFLVWQQSRFGFTPLAEFDVQRDFKGLWSATPVNVFVLKATYWIGR